MVIVAEVVRYGLCINLSFLFSFQLHGVDDAISKSKKVLTSMSRRMTRNKWIVGSIIAALIVAILFVLYFKLFH